MDKVKITIDLKNGYGFLSRGDDRSKLAEVEFTCSEKQIRVTDLRVKQVKVGYGTMLMYALMGVMRAEKKVIILFAKLNAIGFYEKLGFTHTTKFKRGTYKGRKLTIANLHSAYSFSQQVDREDFVWIPPNLDDVVVYL